MGFREACTPQEWETLQFAPLWTFHAVAGIDSKIDNKESAALANVMQAYVRDGRGVINGLKQVAVVLDQRAGGNATPFKQAMLLVGINVARASGGFLGVGDPISADEKKALVAVLLAVGLRPDEMM